MAAGTSFHSRVWQRLFVATAPARERELPTNFIIVLTVRTHGSLCLGSRLVQTTFCRAVGHDTRGSSSTGLRVLLSRPTANNWHHKHNRTFQKPQGSKCQRMLCSGTPRRVSLRTSWATCKRVTGSRSRPGEEGQRNKASSPSLFSISLVSVGHCANQDGQHLWCLVDYLRLYPPLHSWLRRRSTRSRLVRKPPTVLTPPFSDLCWRKVGIWRKDNRQTVPPQHRSDLISQPRPPQGPLPSMNQPGPLQPPPALMSGTAARRVLAPVKRTKRGQ